jgi:hypothetical protein
MRASPQPQFRSHQPTGHKGKYFALRVDLTHSRVDPNAIDPFQPRTHDTMSGRSRYPEIDTTLARQVGRHDSITATALAVVPKRVSAALRQAEACP